MSDALWDLWDLSSMRNIDEIIVVLGQFQTKLGYSYSEQHYELKSHFEKKKNDPDHVV